MQAGLLTTYRNNIQRRGLWAFFAMALLFAFYVLIYFTELLTPVANTLHLGSKWNLYGSLYTIAIVLGGVYFLRRHGNSRYHLIRTISVIFFQVVFAFSIPLIMQLMEMKGFTFSIFWPLKIDYFYPSYIMDYPIVLILYAFLTSIILVPLLAFLVGKRWYCSWVCGCGGLAETAGEPFRHLSDKTSKSWRFEQFSIHSILLFAFLVTVLVIVNWSTGVSIHGEITSAAQLQESATEAADNPRLVLFGSPKLESPYNAKSIWRPAIESETADGMPTMWVATRVGDREISPEMQDDYKLDFREGSLQIATSRPGMDGQMFGTWSGRSDQDGIELSFPQYPAFSTIASTIQGIYAFVVVALLSGILGVGLYPVLGTRVWCRFFCPLAAILGIVQKFGRFRITVKDDMCISCGNCSTYCEMGIDVRAYAQNNQSFKRAACVGCGMCAHMCPRGVLKLENKWDLGPNEESSHIQLLDM